MHASPRIRRLRNDLAALARLRTESSVFRFSSQGDPPTHYFVSFQGRSLWRDRGKVKTLDMHRVEIKLGSSYPRTIPEIRWITPIYHPNISEIGMVCLGGYGTHWVPSVQLDELIAMLWDMARYHNYDIRSPYNRDAALWVANQTAIRFPTDSRPLRDIRAALGRIASSDEAECISLTELERAANGSSKRRDQRRADDSLNPAARVRQFIDRYRRGPSPGGAAGPARGESSSQPANSELQALATAVAASTPPPDEGQIPLELIILDSNDDRAARTQPPQPSGEEIVFIE